VPRRLVNGQASHPKMDCPPIIRILSLLAICTLCTSRSAAAARFSFGPGPIPAGYTQVLPGAVYSATLGYGFEPGSDVTAIDRGGPDPLRRHFCTGLHPFLFSVALAEGNYTVTVVLGDPMGEATTTIKAELRRLEVEEQHTDFGRTATRTFVVNLRTPRIGPDREVHLKPREKTGEARDWDGKLTLEFLGERPCLCALSIEAAPLVPTVYLAGDSTVCDQPYEPYSSWGQMLPRFFGPGVAVANHAESGESLRSFIAENRLAKLDSLMRPGDTLLIQFGHNDQKERGENVGAFTSFTADLERFIDDARAHGAVPVLVTPVSRRTFQADGRIANSLGDYPEAMRRVARERGVTLIDLNSASKTLYEALGPAKAATLFAVSNGRADGTHHNNYGSYELAKCVVEGLRAGGLALAQGLLADTPRFDPSRPDSLDQFMVPASPKAASEVPYGN
jgi:lysophospholipase L1-like esterase